MATGRAAWKGTGTMMGVDALLAERARTGNPIRVAMAGCGFMGRGLVNQIVNSVPGMTLSAIAVRTPDQAIKALTDAGVDEVAVADGLPALNRAIRCEIPAAPATASSSESHCRP